MKLIKNWRQIAGRSHSMWAFYLSFLALVLPDAIYLLTGIDTNPRLWWIIGVALLAYGIFGRLKAQNIDHPSDGGDPYTDAYLRSPPWIAIAAVVLLIGGGVVLSVSAPPDRPDQGEPSVLQLDGVPSETAFLDVAVPLVAKWEGLRLSPYLDPVGVLTVCYGETQGVRRGDTYTEEECRQMLARRILEYRIGLHRHFTVETRTRRLTPERDAAYASLAYNVGVAGAGGSTATRRLNAGDIPGGCEALTWWNKAGGRVLRGLVRRRSEERDLCLLGVGKA
ncbi:lysozyme [Pseudooceanicola sp.]|uniref:lysozyme n=1 Tax=Pseudooceanicola sp. TaxID=1914328 RepID=UPI004058FA75